MRKKILRLSFASLSLAAAVAASAKPAMAFSGECPNGTQELWLNPHGDYGLYDCYYTGGADCSQCNYYCVDIPGTVTVNMCEQ